MTNPTCPIKPAQLESIGSAWVLANFHTHTPGSSDYTKKLRPTGALTHEKLAQGILDDCLAQNIRVIAITDHNSPSFVPKQWSPFRIDPEKESYYAIMRRLVSQNPKKYGGILVLPGVEIGAENIHVLGIFRPSDDPGFDVLTIASILEQGGCPPAFYGDATKSCTEFSVGDAIDIISARGGIAIPAHIDATSGFLKEEDQNRLLKMIVAHPNMFAVEYINDAARYKLEKYLCQKQGVDSIYSVRGGRAIAWTQSSDSHFVQSFDPNQDGNGMPLGTHSRRTWLRLDPDALSFDAVRAALLDPENRVRVDATKKARGRQGRYKPIPAGRTYIKSMQVDWGHNNKETISYNEGINAIVGSPEAGKSARTRLFSVAGCATASMSVVDEDAIWAENSPSAKSVDMVLEQTGTSQNTLWWIHRKDANQAFVAPVERHNNNLRIVPRAPRKWINLFPNELFDRRSLANYFESLPEVWRKKAPSIPQGFSLQSMKSMLMDPVRTMWFVVTHYMPSEQVSAYTALTETLRELLLSPVAMSQTQLSNEIHAIFNKLDPLRKKAFTALNKHYKHNGVGIVAKRKKGKWNTAKRKQVVAEILQLAHRTPQSVTPLMSKIEDTATISLCFDHPNLEQRAALSDRLHLAIQGMLLVIGAKRVGPIVLDAPGRFFEPGELVKILAPMVLDSRDEGIQFVMAADNHNLPFAVDANALIVCTRDPRPGRIGKLDIKCSGGLENYDTAMWALENLDGGGDMFSRREEYYQGVVGSSLAVEQESIAKVLDVLNKK